MKKEVIGLLFGVFLCVVLSAAVLAQEQKEDIDMNMSKVLSPMVTERRVPLQSSVTDGKRADYNLLELSARPWLYELGIDSLSKVPDSVLDEYKAKGINVIYLLGLWELGTAGLSYDRTNLNLLSGYAQTLPDDFVLDDVIGSCFAVTQYKVNEREIATEEELRQFRDRLHARGMKLFVDYVPNHTAVDSELVMDRPDYFVRAPPGEATPYDNSKYLPSGIAYGRDKWGSIWYDTAQYNLWNPATIESRIEELLTIADLADGFRCDMAMLVLNSQIDEIWGSTLRSWGFDRPAEEFWKVAIERVKAKYPDIIFMAEVYWNLNSELIDTGFDYTYDKEGLYDTLASKDPNNVASYLKSKSEDYLIHGTHFVENHDEGRAVAKFGSVPVADAAAAISFLIPGMKFHFMGQWEGKKNKLDVHLRRSAPEEVSSQAVDWYNRLVPLLSQAPFVKGTFSYYGPWGSSNSWKLVAWFRQEGNTAALCIVNYSDTPASGAVNIAGIQPDEQGGYMATLEDKFHPGTTQSVDTWTAQYEGIWFNVDPWDAQIWYYTSTTSV